MDEEAVAKYHDPDPEMLARCTELRTLQVALALIVFREDFGDMKGWNEGIRSMLDLLRLRTAPGPASSPPTTVKRGP
jgi:hypothetical protein